MDRWLQSFRAELETADLLRGVRRLVIAVSGGPDSVCLLELFHEWVREIDPGLEIMVGHVHHGIRGAEADRDARFVQALAEERGLPFLFERGSAPAVAAEGGTSLEMAARRVRFNAFRAWVLDHALDAVALGHHFDDQAETVLLRAIRGSGLGGLGGIPRRRTLLDGAECGRRPSPSQAVIIRPLLAWRSSEILSFLAARELVHREDSSNRDRSIPRNRLRSDILPALEGTQPGAATSLVRLGELARRAHADFRDLAQRAFGEARIGGGGGGVVFDANRLARWPDSVLHEVFALALRNVVPSGRVRKSAEVVDIGWEEYERVLARKPFESLMRAIADWLRGGKHGAKVIELGSGAEAELRYGKVRVRACRSRTESGQREVEPVLLRAPASPEVTAGARWGGWEFSLDWHSVSSERVLKFVNGSATRCPSRQGPSPPELAPGGECAEVFDLDVLESLGPLHVRGRSGGDVFHPLGAPGRKKLKEFFRECEVAPGERPHVPLLASGETIQWVVGYRIGHLARCRPGTRRVLKVRASRRMTKSE